jgi:regulator of replication initiation timing
MESRQRPRAVHRVARPRPSNDVQSNDPPRLKAMSTTSTPAKERSTRTAPRPTAAERQLAKENTALHAEVTDLAAQNTALQTENADLRNDLGLLRKLISVIAFDRPVRDAITISEGLGQTLASLKDSQSAADLGDLYKWVTDGLGALVSGTDRPKVA